MSSSRPLVSVCIPVFNGEAFLEEAVRSVLSQTFADVEVCIQDNASTDRSWEIAQSFGDPRVKPERNPTNVGFVANFNRTFLRAEGKYVRPLCADDALEPACLERQLSLIAERDDLQVVFTAFTALDLLGRRTPSQFEGLYARLPSLLGPEAAARLYFDEGCVTALSTALAEKERMGLFDLSFKHACDWAKWVELLSKGPIGFIREPLTCIRLHAGQLSAGPLANAVEESFRVLDSLEPLLPLDPSRIKARRRAYSSSFLETALRRALRGSWAEAYSILGSVRRHDSVVGAAAAWPRSVPSRLLSLRRRRAEGLRRRVEDVRGNSPKE